MHPHPFLALARLALGATLALASHWAAAQAPARTPPPPTVALQVTHAGIPIEIRRVAVEGYVVGLAAQTRIEIEFFNPNPRVLEGELQFPLQAGQTVTGFSLDINGEMRPAVPVDKAKGRQVFEDVIRTRVDPALLEATGGDNYKLRVYPLPARGSRRVVLELAQALDRGKAGGRPVASYAMPLVFAAPVQRLDAVVYMPARAGKPAQAGSFGAQRLAAQRAQDGSDVVTLRRTDYQGRDTLRVDVPLPAGETQAVAQAFGDATYFYAEVPVATQTRARPAPARIAVVWDASGSAKKRDRERELALLDALFQRLRQVDVQLLVVRDVAEAPRRFAVAGGDWQDLREHLRNLAYDGATRLDQMAVPAGAQLALLFSDGLGNYGAGSLPASTVPLYAVSSAAGTDAMRLRQLAEDSGGALLDLARSTPVAAAGEVLVQRTRLLGLSGDGARDLLSEGRYPQDGRLRIAGRLDQPRAQLALELQEPDGTRTSRRIALPAAAQSGHYGLPIAAYRWATLQLAQLEADRERHAAAIRRLGMQFGLVTSGTSLIVLDAVEDYARHDIEPPPSLRPAWQALVARRGQKREADQQAHLERVARRFQEKQAWWERAFPKDAPPAPKPQAKADQERRGQALAERDRAAVQRAAPAPMAPPAHAPMPAPMAPAPAPAAAPAAARATAAAADTSSRANQAPAGVALKRWQPDSPYVRRLRAAPVDAMYATYLDERPGYTGSTAFFLDCADIFVERGQPDLALRILSNLAEMDLENRQVLRILAYRLLQAGQVQVALPVLQKVLALSPDEPQSYRDLGLALASAGQYQQAADKLWDVVRKPWNDRFPDIELVALAELNAVVARAAAAGQPLQLAAIDPRLLRNLPLDLRAVLAWDADNTDIDLHVIDPNGEEAYYGRRLTYQGGRMSNDFTGGYGPEEFSLRQAKPGAYVVKAHFYGHRQQVLAPATTLMLRLTTGFGTPAQKDHDVVLRLATTGGDVLVGTFEVPAQAAAEQAR